MFITYRNCVYLEIAKFSGGKAANYADNEFRMFIGLPPDFEPSDRTFVLFRVGRHQK